MDLAFLDSSAEMAVMVVCLSSVLEGVWIVVGFLGLSIWCYGAWIKFEVARLVGSRVAQWWLVL